MIGMRISRKKFLTHLVGGGLLIVPLPLLSKHLSYDGYIFVKSIKTQNKTFFYITSLSRGTKYQYTMIINDNNVFDFLTKIEKMFKDFFGHNIHTKFDFNFDDPNYSSGVVASDIHATYHFNGREVYRHLIDEDLAEENKPHGCKLGFIIHNVLTNCYNKGIQI